MVKTDWANSTEEHWINAVKAETLETDEVNSENDYEVTEMQWQMEKVRSEKCWHRHSSKWNDSERRLLPLKLKQMKSTQEGSKHIPT